jgi:hypothetical protein
MIVVLSIRQAACAGRWIESPEQRANPKRRPSFKDNDDSSVGRKSSAKSTGSRRGSVVKKSTAKARINRRTSNMGNAVVIEEGNEEEEDDDVLSMPSKVTIDAAPEPDTVELLVEHWFER